MSVRYPQCIFDEIVRLRPLLTRWRRDMHTFPEAGWTEFRTASQAIRHLRALGFSICMGPDACTAEERAGVPSASVLEAARQRALREGADPYLVARMGEGFTGFWADLEGGLAPAREEAPVTLAFRFDMDCNELAESVAPEHRPVAEGYTSRHEGLMHACGHDGHVAIGLGLAELLAVLRPHLRGRIRLVFQPAEEGARGARPMVRAGAVEGVGTFIGMHVGFRATDAATIVCGTQGFLATTKWDVSFFGKPSHAAAAPEEGKNALLAACTATLHLHAIARNGNGLTRIAVGRLEGGEARNVVPASARLFMETRGENTDLDAYMCAEAERMLQASADMWGCSWTKTMVGGSHGGGSSPDLACLIAEVAEEAGFTNRILMQDFGATEDVACFMEAVQDQGGQASYMQIGTVRSAGHHDNRFDFDEACLERAVLISGLLACRLAGQPNVED